MGRGNDLECSHAGALGGADGISLVAGTGSMTWGTWQGRAVRCGGWGEVFGDEGSAYWIAREGLALFSRMSDGRAERGAALRHWCARAPAWRATSTCRAAWSTTAPAARWRRMPCRCTRRRWPATRPRAHPVRAARELVQLVRATRRLLGVPSGAAVAASTSGSVLGEGGLVLQELARALAEADGAGRIELRAPLMLPALGAVALAARTAGRTLSPAAVEALAQARHGLD